METEFRKSLINYQAINSQKEIVIGKIKEEIKEEINNFLAQTQSKEYLEHETLDIEIIIKKVALRHGIIDFSHISNNVINDKDMSEYIESAEQIIEEQNRKIEALSNDQIGYQNKKNREASETFQKYIEQAQEIFERLPEENRYNPATITEAFGDYNWKKEHLWIDLAVRHVWGVPLEVCPKPNNLADRVI